MPLVMKGIECQLKKITLTTNGVSRDYYVCMTKKIGPCPKDKKPYEVSKECFESVSNDDFIALMVEQQG